MDFITLVEKAKNSNERAGTFLAGKINRVWSIDQIFSLLITRFWIRCSPPFTFEEVDQVIFNTTTNKNKILLKDGEKG